MESQFTLCKEPNVDGSKHIIVKLLKLELLSRVRNGERSIGGVYSAFHTKDGIRVRTQPPERLELRSPRTQTNENTRHAGLNSKGTSTTNHGRSLEWSNSGRCGIFRLGIYSPSLKALEARQEKKLRRERVSVVRGRADPVGDTRISGVYCTRGEMAQSLGTTSTDSPQGGERSNV